MKVVLVVLSAVAFLVAAALGFDVVQGSDVLGWLGLGGAFAVLSTVAT